MKKKSPKRKISKKVSLKRKKFLFWQRGGIPETVLLAIVIVGAFFLVGGVFSDKFLSPSGAPFDGVPDIEKAQQNRDSLQLGTIPFKKCSSIVTMDLLLDRSGSMNSKTESGVRKIERLKEAVLALTNKLSDDSVIGIQSFDSLTGTTNDVPVSYYRNVKTTIPTQVNALSPGGQTPTHDALAYSYDVLQQAVKDFPDRKFNFIFITDGQPIPETQDPRLFTPNPATQIKDLGVNVYTVGIYDRNQGVDTRLADLLKNTASAPENYFEAKSGDDVKNLLAQISNKICEGGSDASASAQ